uniref:RIKEN cDNA 4921539E11 gene n=1 Tax=Cricetulus griseus TaxID=10029 RepID=A0A8C2MPJ9_CRIGR
TSSTCPCSMRYVLYANPLNSLQSWPRNQCKCLPESSILYPIPAGQSKASKEKVSTPFTGQNERRAKKSMHSTDHSADSIENGKYHPWVNNLITKEKKSDRDKQARTPCPVNQNVFLPLHIEDVLKNPEIKIIDLGPTDRVLSYKSHTNPIIFHDTAYIEMLFLAKRFTPYMMTYTTKNVVLEKNLEMLKELFNNQSSYVSNPQNLLIFSSQLVQERINEKRKKKQDSLVSKNRCPSTLYNLSRTLSSITKKFVGYFDKDATQEKSDEIDEFERTFSKTKPSATRKLTTLPIKSDSKPLKNIFEIRKLNNITPLDNLVSWKA